LERFASATRAGAAAYLGKREGKKDSLFSRLGSWASGKVCNWIHKSNYEDFNSALKLVRGDVLRSIPLEAKGLNYSTEITSRLLERGVQLVELPVEHRPRQGGQSSMKALKGALHRLLFVFYIGVRQLLLRAQVLQVREVEE
jgi:hypothetical protein